MSDPVARTVKDFCRTYGIGKSLAYELMSVGTLSAVKAGTRTLILEESAKAWFLSLPGASTSAPTSNTRIMKEVGGHQRKVRKKKLKQIN